MQTLQLPLAVLLSIAVLSPLLALSVYAATIVASAFLVP
jgi:hypothetical protein